MSRDMGPTERAGHEYADRGWPVFPLMPFEKVPATAHGFQDATTDHRQIERHWSPSPDRNVAIATGKPGPDVLDIDVADAKPGLASFSEVKRAGLVPTPMRTVRTRSGGWHGYYLGTDQRSGSTSKGLDFRSAGGYVVAAPSKVGGRPYEVVSDGGTPAVIRWEPIRDHLDPQHGRPGRTPAREGQRLGHLVDRIRGLPDGHGRGANGLTYWAMTRAYEAGDLDTVNAIASAAIERGLTPRSVAATQRSAERTALRSLPKDHARGREAG